MWGLGHRPWVGGSVVLAGLVVVVVNVLQGDVVLAAIVLVLVALLVGVLLWWGRASAGGTQLSHAAAQAAAGDGDVIVYWRPGCLSCDRLRLGLGRARHDVAWVNIWEDAEAAAFVTTRRGGDQTVPTAVTGAGRMIDATPAAIKAQLAAARPARS